MGEEQGGPVGNPGTDNGHGSRGRTGAKAMSQARRGQGWGRDGEGSLPPLSCWAPSSHLHPADTSEAYITLTKVKGKSRGRWHSQWRQPGMGVRQYGLEPPLWGDLQHPVSSRSLNTTEDGTWVEIQ